MADRRSPNSLSSFGEVSAAPTGLAGRLVRGAERMLTITELQRVGEGRDNLQPTGVEFRFGRENRSAPRGNQEYPLKLRTVREDLPGAEDPTEQVLGWNYEPFTVKGVWDDRYGGAGFADQTRRDFTEMVKRGHFIRYQFEQISYTGLIVNFVPTYVRKDYWMYSFTISPHFVTQGETVRVEPNSGRQITTDPKNSVIKARAGLDEIQAAQARATAERNARVQSLLKQNIFSSINSDIDQLDQFISSTEQMVDDDLLGAPEQAVRTLSRGAQVMLSAKTAAASILSKQGSLVRQTNMTVASFVEGLKFEGWHRTLGGASRQFIVQSESSRRDFALRAKPKAARLHRVKGGESMYQISQQYYGTPHHWREILSANKLTSLVLYGGELLVIPEI